METNFNFNSQVCTDKNQSERLLALGLKKETEDCYWFYCDIAKEWKCTILSSTQVFKDYPTTVIPAWSLGRLLELIKHSDICHYNDFGCIKLYIDLDDFKTCITMISYMVKEEHFNKEYLA